MAPFDSALTTKISPLIDGQVPDHIQADHPIFVEFLRQYYKFLESAQITIDGTIDQVLLETLSENFLVLDGTDISGSNAADKIVFETGSGTTGKFEVGETITGSTSKATATILVDNDETLFISSNQRFIEGETITGASSSATSTLKKYRANPVQNIQQLFEYADPDNTVDHFLTAFKDSFMESIPQSLASGVSKRNLIKQIRDLYAAKGTSEGHKLFFRIFLGQDAIINYPAQYMLRMSDGNWSKPVAIRCTSDSAGALPDEMAGQEITGASSGTTAQIISVSQFNQGTDSVVEFILREDSIQGSGFTTSETITGKSTSGDFTMQFTIQGIVLSVTTGDFGGILYEVGDTVTLDPLVGNGKATANVSKIKSGSISDIHIDAPGSGYNVGDSIKFTNDASDSSVNSAQAFVSVTGGRLNTEESTSTTPTFFNLEAKTQESFIKQRILLNGTAVATVTGEPYAVHGTDRRFSDSKTYYFPLYLSEERAKAKNTETGTASFFIFDQYPGQVFWGPSNNLNTAQSTYSTSLYNLFHATTPTLDDGFSLRLESGNAAVDSGGVNTEAVLGDLILSETDALARDTYGTPTDGIILEEGSLGIDEFSEINRVFLVNGGSGYTAMPSATISTVNGTEGKVVALTTDIGQITEIEIKDSGFKYSSAPGVTANTNLILKDVTGTFGAGNTLQTHTGSVVAFTPATNKLTISSTPTNRLQGEQLEATNDGITLEDFDIVEPGRPDHGPIATVYKVNDEFGSGILLDGYSEEGSKIVIESFEIGNIATDGFETFVDQISMEVADMDSPIDEGIELESGLFVPTDSSGRFLLDSHREKPFLRSQRTEDNVLLEDAAAGTNIFGEQETGLLRFNFSMEDVGDSIDLEFGTPDRGNRGRIQAEIGTESSTGMGRLPRIVFDGTGLIDNDAVEYELDTSIVFGNNDDAIILEDSLPDGSGSPSYLVNEDQGNAIILNTSGGQDNLDDVGDKLLQPVFDVSAFSNHGQSIAHANTPDGRLLGEGLETFILETSISGLREPTIRPSTPIQRMTAGAGSFILYDNAVYPGDEDGYGNIIREEDGGKILNEHSGQNMLLDGTDASSTDAGDQVLMENETGTDQIILDRTATDGTDAGDEIVMEDAFNVIGDNILDSGGASGVILAQGTAQGTAQIGTTITKPGGYLNTNSLIDEDVVRIQDSYFYQQFSYEVTVGSVLSAYINELKASVHPAGFIPFGKVSLASQVAARLGDPAAGGVIDYTGDDTFTPELASLFGIVFGETIDMTTGVREGTGILDPTGGSSLKDTLIQENGVAIGDLLLEETDGDNLQFESGLDIAIENSASSGDGAILLDVGAGSGRVLLETALGETVTAKRFLQHITELKVRPEIKAPQTAYGAPLLSGIEPGSLFFDQPFVQLEDGMRDKLPAIMKDNLLLDGTDTFGTNAGDKIAYESSHDLNIDSGVRIGDISNISVKDLVEIDTIGFIEGRSDDGNYYPVPEGGIVFEQSAASDELVLEDYMHFILEGGRLSDVLLLENGHTLLQESNSQPFTLEDNLQAFPDGTNELTHIRLETATDSTGHLLGEGIQAGDNSINIVLDGQLHRGEKLLTEGSKIEFEDNTNTGSIPDGLFGNKNIEQYTREARIFSHNVESFGGRLALQDEFEIGLEVALEDGTGSIIFDGTSAVLDIEGQILLDGTDSAKTDAGDKVILDASASGTDVGENLLLDSTGGRDLGDKLIMFDTIRNVVVGNEGGSFLLDGTDGTSSNAGDEILLEVDYENRSGTLEFLKQNSINIANALPSEGGGLTLPISEADAGEGQVLVTTFDSAIGTFDSTQTTFDAA